MKKKNDKIYIEHIIQSIRRIIEFTENVTEKEFIEKPIIQDAVIRNFEIIGEASKKISTDFGNRHKGIPWKKMAGMRDILIHDYMGVDLWAVWATVIDSLPELKKQIEDIF